MLSAQLFFQTSYGKFVKDTLVAKENKKVT